MSTVLHNTHTIAEPSTLARAAISAPTPPAAPRSKRCIELDGLRGLAALCAVLYHYTDRASRINAAVRMFRHAVSISPAGMDMFFVLSGFLIGGILLKSVKSPNYYKTFYVRRFFRIIPIYYLWVIVFGIAAFLSPSIRSVLPHGYTLPVVIGVYFLFIQNFATPVLRVIWLEAAWSLAVEEHFYLFMPALVRRFSVKQLVQGLVAVILLSPPLRIAVSLLFKRNGGEWGWWTVYAWTFCRIDALALGVLLAIVWANPKAKAWLQDRIRWVYASMAAFLVLSAMFEYLTANQVRYT
ncbi:MAG: acyltransferase family protein, partial [Candidatus Acidiferrales bacterium]